MKDTIQISAYRRQMSGNIHAMFRSWINEAIKHSIIEIQDEIIKTHYHAKEGWELAGTRLDVIKDLETIIMRLRNDAAYAARPIKEPRTPISVLKIPNRIMNRLQAEGYQSIGDLIDNTECEVMKFRNIGKIGYKILKDELARHGYALRSMKK